MIKVFDIHELYNITLYRYKHKNKMRWEEIWINSHLAADFGCCDVQRIQQDSVNEEKRIVRKETFKSCDIRNQDRCLGDFYIASRNNWPRGRKEAEERE